jgi:hypothetical protein
MSSTPQLPGVTDAEPLLAALEAAWQADALAWLDRAELIVALHQLCGEAEQTVGELALLLHTSAVTAGRLLSEALGLRRFAPLADAVRAGRLDQARAKTIVEQLEGTPSADAADLVLDRLLAGDQPVTRTPAQLRVWLSGQLTAADPEGAAAQRREQIRRRSGVRFRPLLDGLAEAVVTGPVDSVLGLMRTLDAATPPPDPTRLVSRGQQQLAAFLALFAAGAEAAGIPAPAVELRLDLPCEVVSDEAGGWRTHLDGAALAQPEPLQIACTAGGLEQVVRSLEAVLAGLRHLGQVPARVVTTRDVGSDEDSEIWVDPETGEVLRQSGLIDLDSLRAALDSPGAWRSAALPVELLPTLTGYGVVDPGQVARILLRHSLTASGPPADPDPAKPPLRDLEVRRVMVEPTAGACAVDAVALALARLVGPDAAPIPQPPAPTASYRFTADQVRVLRARDTTCTHPGCRRRAVLCDLDHLVPWPAGPTTIGNAAPKCRKHHRWKHAGWTVVRFPDGSEEWTSPLGRTYRNRDDLG